MEKEYCVYIHTAPNGKRYVGITCRKPQQRWGRGSGYKTSPHFCKAIKKYGWENIEHEVVLTGLTCDQAKAYEQMFISMYRSNEKEFGYNLTSGGDSGSVPNLEAIEKMRANNKWKRKVDQYSIYGDYIATFDSCAEADRIMGFESQTASKCAGGSCMSAQGYIWVYHDDPNKEEIVKSRVKKIQMGPIDSRSRPIAQYSKHGELIRIHENLTEAAKTVNAEPSHLWQCAEGQRISSHGYIWLYADDPLLQNKLARKVWAKAHGGGMYNSGNHQAKAVEQYDLNGVYIQTFATTAEAERATGIHHSTISHVANKSGRSKTAGNFVWIFANEKDKAKAVEERLRRVFNDGKSA